MNEIYVAHEVIFKKSFNKHTYYHGDLLGCNFDNQYFVSKEVVLLTVDKDGKLCYFNTKAPCNPIDYQKLQRSTTLFECRFCSNHLKKCVMCDKSVNIPTEVIGVINVMPIYEFTKNGYIPEAIVLVKEYNDSVKGEIEPVNNKNYIDTMKGINSGFTRVRSKNEK